jgi:RES domain-containing protein
VPAAIAHVPVAGTWHRHLLAGREPLGFDPDGQGRWQRARIIGAVYLADSEQTAWAEFYRAAAEARRGPLDLLPRDVWSYRVELDHIADLSTHKALAAAGLARTTPTSAQWPTYQAVGEHVAAAGAQGVLYRSAARPRHLCLCVFVTALDRVHPIEHRHIAAPPAPPRGMRT